MTTPQDVIATFSRLAMPLRRPSYNQEVQAMEFAKSFTIEELETVIAFVQREIAGSRLDWRSLQWHCIFGTLGSGSEFEIFQSRLAAAQKTVRTRPSAKQVAVTHDVGDGKVTRLQIVDTPEEATPEMRERIAASLVQLKNQMRA